MAVEDFAPAKINLTLHVTGQRDDGYHLLDSLVVFASVGDVVSVSSRPGLTVSVTGPEAAGVPRGDDNSTLQAARFLGADDMAISLTKNLPCAAGIGGGSSDAAATLRAISRLRKTPIPEDVLRLGADVPVCLRATATRMSGIGEILEPVPGLPEIWGVLANPRVPVSTQAVFQRLQSKSNPAMPRTLPTFGSAQALARWVAAQRNDLQQAAIGEQPVIADVLAALSALPGCLLARMSGSGATCFALFDNAATAAHSAENIKRDHSDWWVTDARLS